MADIEKNKALIQAAFRDVIEDCQATETTIAHYFSPDYIQSVDDKILNFEQFVSHMKVQKSVVETININLLKMVGEGDIVCSHHEVYATKKNGDALKAKVIAFFTIKNGKIIRCDELTHLLEGAQEDHDLGSRYE